MLDQRRCRAPLGQRLLLQRLRRPNLKIVLVPTRGAMPTAALPMEYLESARARRRDRRARASRSVARLYAGVLLALASRPGLVERPFRRNRAASRACARRSARATARRISASCFVADDGAGGWVSLLPADAGGDLAVADSRAASRATSRRASCEIAAWSSGDDRLPAAAAAAVPRGPGSIDARFLTEGAIRGAMLDALAGSAAAGDEIATGGAALERSPPDRRPARSAAARGAHVRVLLDPEAAPNTAVAAELAARRRRKPRAALARAAGAIARRPSPSSSGAASSGRARAPPTSRARVSTTSISSRRRAAPARARRGRPGARGATSTDEVGGRRPVCRAMRSNRAADYWRYRLKEAAALAAF